jgi:nucleoside phosphorylase
MIQSDYTGLKTWIVSAWWPEQSHLAEEISTDEPVKVIDDSFRVVRNIGFLTTGVGTPRAALNLGSALANAAAANALPDRICFLATAGAYDSHVPLESAHLVTKAGWSDGDLARSHSYLPKVERCEYLDACVDLARIVDSRCLRALSTPGISLDPQLANSLSQLAELENLEIFGVALAAARFGVPWSACLGVSNTVGAMAHEQWKAHHLRASQAAQALLMKSIPEAFFE